MAKLRLAFLGAGGWAGRHAGLLAKSPDAEIVAACDVSEDVVNPWLETHLKGYEPRPAVFTDAAKMYADVKPDAVAICTPHTLHFEHCMQALDAGCHVFVEKPMVTDAGQAYTLRDRVDELGRTLVVGYNTACSPRFKYLRDEVRKGTFGKLELVQGYISQGWMKGTTGKWRQDPKLSGGGQAYDSGAHLFNSLCWTVESPVAEVFAFVDNHGTRVDINSVTSIRFENGVLANITVGGNCPGSGSFMVFIFDGGRVEIDGWGGAYIKAFGSDGKQIEDLKVEGVEYTALENFVAALLGKDDPPTNPTHGVIQTELMDAIYESQRTGGPARPKRRG
jgi:predicted dehydrogenase